MYHFHVRDAETSRGDGEFILAAFDSAMPYLASIGSHEQWGTTPFSEQDGWTAETRQQIHDAETYRRTGGTGGAEQQEEEEEGARRRIFIVEAKEEQEGMRAVPVGFAFVREQWIPTYIVSQPHLAMAMAVGVGVDEADRASCLYLEVMAADHRVDDLVRKGCGATLIQGIKAYGQRSGKKCLFVDGWAGNERKLIRFVPNLSWAPSPSRQALEKGLKGMTMRGSYYERQGFQVVDDFTLPRKGKSPWLGTLLRMDIPKEQ